MSNPRPKPTPASKAFGQHIRSCRLVRGLTQQALAEKSGLAADTIRRLELGSFSPSLETLRKTCGGLDLNLSTLFDTFELGECEVTSQIVKQVEGMSPDERVAVLEVLRAARSVVASKSGDDEE